MRRPLEYGFVLALRMIGVMLAWLYVVAGPMAVNTILTGEGT